MKITLSFLGAAQCVTGSRFLLDVGGTQVMVDCGLFQGHRKETNERNANFPVEPAAVHTALLTHAHVDHSGALPLLVRGGYEGVIHCTSATADLVRILLRDSASIHEGDAEHLNRLHANEAQEEGRKLRAEEMIVPLYTMEDAERCDGRFAALPYGQPQEVAPGIQATLSDQGHILGSAAVLLEVRAADRSLRILFSGDRGRKSLPILRDPEPYPPCDVAVTESTYGDRIHPPAETMTADLVGKLAKTLKGGGRVVMPAFSVGRTQNILYWLYDLIVEKRLPTVPVFVDSPLSARATQVYLHHPECFDEETRELLYQKIRPSAANVVHYVESTDESRALNDRKGPCIIVTASGMCEGGRVLHHLIHAIGDPRNLVVITGFMAEGTLGRRLVDGEKQVRIFDHMHTVRAGVEQVRGLSAHADQHDLVDSLHHLAGSVSTIFVVHGEPRSSETLKGLLEKDGHRDVRTPTLFSTVEL